VQDLSDRIPLPQLAAALKELAGVAPSYATFQGRDRISAHSSAASTRTLVCPVQRSAPQSSIASGSLHDRPNGPRPTGTSSRGPYWREGKARSSVLDYWEAWVKSPGAFRLTLDDHSPLDIPKGESRIPRFLFDPVEPEICATSGGAETRSAWASVAPQHKRRECLPANAGPARASARHVASAHAVSSASSSHDLVRIGRFSAKSCSELASLTVRRWPRTGGRACSGHGRTSRSACGCGRSARRGPGRSRGRRRNSAPRCGIRNARRSRR
jgi:hypothetical protein